MWVNWGKLEQVLVFHSLGIFSVFAFAVNCATVCHSTIALIWLMLLSGNWENSSPCAERWVPRSYRKCWISHSEAGTVRVDG